MLKNVKAHILQNTLSILTGSNMEEKNLKIYVCWPIVVELSANTWHVPDKSSNNCLKVHQIGGSFSPQFQGFIEQLLMFW